MRIANKLRIATRDTANAMEIACGEVESAVGVPVQPEFQEIDGTCLIVELRLVDETECTPHPHRLAHTVESYASNVEVLSSWKESNALRPKARASATTCWVWTLTRCHPWPFGHWMMAFQLPSGNDPTLHGTWRFRRCVANNSSSASCVNAATPAGLPRSISLP